MSSTTTEQLQPLLPLLAQMLGHRPSPATVWRWTAHGVKSGDSRVKLRAIKIGGKLYSSREAVQHFIDKQNPAFVDTDEQPARSTETSRGLERVGLLQAQRCEEDSHTD